MNNANNPLRRFWVSAIAATKAILTPLKTVEGTAMPAYEISDEMVGMASTYAWYQFERSYFGMSK